jgi:two-component system NtrC family sensor kinase
MVIRNKQMLIEKLTGIHSSKKTYYVELQKKLTELSKRNIQLEIINQLAKSIGINMSLQEIIGNFIPKLQTLFHFDALSLYIVKNDGQIHRVVFFVGPNQENKFSETHIPASMLQQASNAQFIEVGSDLWHALNHKEAILLNNVSSTDLSLSKDAQFHTQETISKILIPLLVKERVIGVLEVAGRHEFNKDDLIFIEQVADQLAVCLENMQLYNEVWQRKQEWEITFSAVTDLLVFINQSSEIQKVNKAAIEFFTLKEEEIIGQKCYQLFYGRKEKCNPCLADQVLQTKKTSYSQARTRYNRILDIFAYPAYINEEEPYGVTYYAKDVTRFVDSIKFVSLGEMSAGVAHELNSPLTAIVGNSQLLLRETADSSPHYQLVKDIHSCGVRCQGIIRNLLTFSRQDELSFEEVYLDQASQKALALLSYQIDKSKITVIKNLSMPLPAVLGNVQGLEQIIINLLLNAKDAIEGKYSKAQIREKGEIQIKTRFQPGKFVAVDVVDNGCGIDPAKITNIFNPFYTT